MTSKDKLLALLESKRGKLISGEEMAKQLNVSRAAIWKAIAKLKAQGLKIEALPGSGYRLLPESDVLSLEGVKVWLGDKTTPLQVLDETASTNLIAKQWAMEGAANGSLVLANSQVAGKGRFGRRFKSPAGGIYLSIVLRPQCAASKAVMVTAAAAVAVCSAVQNLCGKNLKIKWVNDLFYQNKKCCGILSEAGTNFETGNIDYIVVGIGLNFSTAAEYFEGELENIAGSLYPSSPPPIPRAQLAAEIHRNLLAEFALFPKTTFLEEYRARSLVLGKEITVLANPPYTATAIAINNEAQLVVQENGKAPLALPAGEISIKLF